MAVTHKNMGTIIESRAKEIINSSKYNDGSFSTWSLDAAVGLMSDIATENQQFHDNLIVGSSDSGYTDIENEVPAGHRISAFGANSLYIRQSSLKGAPASRLFFALIQGTAYKFVNKEQSVAWYNLFITYITISHLQDLQATNPNTTRASLISQRQTQVAADIVVFCADATASYDTRTGFDLGVDIQTFDPTITVGD